MPMLSSYYSRCSGSLHCYVHAKIILYVLSIIHDIYLPTHGRCYSVYVLSDDTVCDTHCRENLALRTELLRVTKGGAGGPVAAVSATPVSPTHHS